MKFYNFFISVIVQNHVFLVGNKGKFTYYLLVIASVLVVVIEVKKIAMNIKRKL